MGKYRVLFQIYGDEPDSDTEFIVEADSESEAIDEVQNSISSTIYAEEVTGA